MRSNGRSRSIGAAIRGFTLGILFTVSASTIAGEAEDTAHKAYLDQVISVLRSHVTSMRMILDNDTMKYGDNMARHAEALERTFGMIGPMEWHAAEAFEHMRKSDVPDKLTEEQFDELAQHSHRTIVKAGRAAHRYERDKNKALMHKAINDVIDSCGACHSKLPEGTVPHVWKGMTQ